MTFLNQRFQNWREKNVREGGLRRVLIQINCQQHCRMASKFLVRQKIVNVQSHNNIKVLKNELNKKLYFFSIFSQSSVSLFLTLLVRFYSQKKNKKQKTKKAPTAFIN